MSGNPIYRARHNEQALEVVQGTRHSQLGHYALERYQALTLVHGDRPSHLDYCHVGRAYVSSDICSLDRRILGVGCSSGILFGRPITLNNILKIP